MRKEIMCATKNFEILILNWYISHVVIKKKHKDRHHTLWSIFLSPVCVHTSSMFIRLISPPHSISHLSLKFPA